MSRQVFLLGVGIAVVAHAFNVADQLLRPVDAITPENATQITFGMTEEQVNALLRRPADRARGYALDMTPLRGGKLPIREWKGRRGRIVVYLTRDDWVLRARFWPREPFSSIGCLRSWLGW